MHAWCTSYRFGAEVQPCALSQAEAGDAQQHCVCCAVARRDGRDWLSWPPLPDASAREALIRVLGSGVFYATWAALWIGAVCSTVHVSRRDSRCRSHGAMVARMKQVVHRHPSCRVALACAAP